VFVELVHKRYVAGPVWSFTKTRYPSYLSRLFERPSSDDVTRRTQSIHYTIPQAHLAETYLTIRSMISNNTFHDKVTFNTACLSALLLRFAACVPMCLLYRCKGSISLIPIDENIAYLFASNFTGGHYLQP
jgi:hypothetical protein